MTKPILPLTPGLEDKQELMGRAYHSLVAAGQHEQAEILLKSGLFARTSPKMLKLVADFVDILEASTPDNKVWSVHARIYP